MLWLYSLFGWHNTGAPVQMLQRLSTIRSGSRAQRDPPVSHSSSANRFWIHADTLTLCSSSGTSRIPDAELTPTPNSAARAICLSEKMLPCITSEPDETVHFILPAPLLRCAGLPARSNGDPLPHQSRGGCTATQRQASCRCQGRDRARCHPQTRRA